jgi:hypothetical protein
MADLTAGKIPVATGATQIDDSSLGYDANTGTFSTQMPFSYTEASVIGAAIAYPGSGGGTPGSATVTTTTGVGTPAQIGVTIGGDGTIQSIDSIVVPGNFTTPPDNPHWEPVTGGGITDGVLNLALLFSPTIVGSDNTKGVIINASMVGFAGQHTTASMTDTGDEAEGLWGFIVESKENNSVFGLSVAPAIGMSGEGALSAVGYGSNNAPHLFLNYANGVRGAPSHTLAGDVLGAIYFGGFGAGWPVSVAISAVAEEEFGPGGQGASLRFHSYAINGASVGDRLVIDKYGVVNMAATPRAVADLPASPVAGMIATVNDALAPTVGATVVSGGSASAVVSYGGSQWTVISI